MHRVLIGITNLFWLWTVLGTFWAWLVPEHFTWFLTPYLTKGYASLAVPLKVDALAMVLTMVTIVLLPVIGGVFLNKFFGARLGMVRRVSPIVSVLVIVLIVGAIVGKTKDNIVEYAGTLLPAVFVLHAAGFGLGYAWARLCKLEVRERRTVSIEVGMQNSGLGTELAKTHFSMLAAAPCAISAFYHCIMGSFLASLWRRLDGTDDGEKQALRPCSCPDSSPGIREGKGVQPTPTSRLESEKKLRIS